MNKDEILLAIEKMSVLELVELIEAIEERFNVKANPVPAVVPTVLPVDTQPVEEKTEFDVHMTSFGAKKIQVIKEVRAITGLALKEAKELVDGAPCNVKIGISEVEANEIKSKLEAVGATVEIK